MKARLIDLRIPGLALLILIATITGGRAQEIKTTLPATPAGSNGLSHLQTATPAPAIINPIAIPKLTPGPPEIPVPEAAPIPAPPTPFSGWTKAIIKMAQSGIDEEVMMTYIDSAGTFNLGADEIVYLRDLGISNDVIVAMMQHDADIVSGARPLTMTAAPAPDLPMQLAIAANSAAPSVPTQPVAADNSGPSATTPPVPAGLPVQAADSAAIQSVATPAPEVTAAAASKPSLFAQATRLRPTQQLVYPVRDPNPVELTPPITIVQIPPPERPLNTIVIRFIP